MKNMSGVAALKQVVSPRLKNNTVLLEHVHENTALKIYVQNALKGSFTRKKTKT